MKGSIALARSLCYQINGAADDSDDMDGGGYGSVDIAEILSAEVVRLQKALAQQQPEQEPVAWGVFDGNLHDMFFTEEEAQEMVRLKGDGSIVAPLYTTPPKRPWQGMTLEERTNLENYFGQVIGAFFLAEIETTLEQRNT